MTGFRSRAAGMLRFGFDRSTAETLGQLARHMYAIGGHRLIVAFLLLLVASASESISLLLIIPLLHIATQSGGAGGPRPEWLDGLGQLGELAVSLPVVLVALVVLVGAQALFNMVKSVYLTNLLYRWTNSVRTSLFRAIGKARWSEVSRSRIADLEHALTSDVDRIEGAGFLLLNCAQSIVVIATYGLLAFLVSPAMAGLSMLLGIGLFLVLAPFRRNATRFGEMATGNRREQYRTVSDFLNGLRTAKAINIEGRFFDRLNDILVALARGASDYSRRSAAAGAIFQLGSVVAIAVFAYVAIEVLRLSLGQIVVMTILFARLTPRFMGLQGQVQQLLSALPAYTAVRALDERLSLAAEPDSLGTVPVLKNDLVLEQVTFAYPGTQTDVLRAVDLEIASGEVVALIGSSGAGKSTLADIVLGLLQPDTGRVLVDGVGLDPSNRRSWRDQIAYVPQEVFLLHDTIAANLKQGAPDSSREAMLDALDKARARSFVEALPQGLDTVVGDRGASLSGGQRQRIALAAAMLRQPRLLILDEATSALDWENQQEIAKAVEELKGETTVLVIAHRPSMIVFADVVATLADGRIVEVGRRADLERVPDSQFALWLARENQTTGNASTAKEKVLPR